MALFPCSLCGRRYRGPQQSIYPAFVTGRDSERRHLRLCPDCFDTTLATVADAAVKVDFTDPEPHTPDDRDSCDFCGEEAPDRVFFASVYARGAEEEQYYGHAGPSCAARLHRQWDLGAR